MCVATNFTTESSRHSFCWQNAVIKELTAYLAIEVLCLYDEYSASADYNMVNIESIAWDIVKHNKAKEKEWEWLNPHKYEGCNLRIKRNYINEIKSKEIFRAGKLNERYFILIKRCKNKSRSDNQRM